MIRPIKIDVKHGGNAENSVERTGEWLGDRFSRGGFEKDSLEKVPGTSNGGGLDQLNSVAKRVVDIDAIVAFDGIVSGDRIAGPLERRRQVAESLNQQSRVSLSCRLEI